ncbi:MAG TPA: hypothetical protein PLV45_01950 [bacterium]|nr:hypothetical protein [bacterium]
MLRQAGDRFLHSPKWGMFFFKFAIFSVLAFLLWNLISRPYGHFLCERVVAIQRSRLPIMDVKYTDYRGLTMKMLIGPAVNAPAPLKSPQPVPLEIYPNTLHFNIIPFLALLLATPLQSKKRLILFLVLGFLFLSLTHVLHLFLDIEAYYFGHQTFVIDKARMAPDRLQEAQTFIYMIRLTAKLQGFMEQAGSMIVPAFIWMIYSQRWLFQALLKKNQSKRKLPPKPVSENKES